MKENKKSIVVFNFLIIGLLIVNGILRIYFSIYYNFTVINSIVSLIYFLILSYIALSSFFKNKITQIIIFIIVVLSFFLPYYHRYYLPELLYLFLTVLFLFLNGFLKKRTILDVIFPSLILIYSIFDLFNTIRFYIGYLSIYGINFVSAISYHFIIILSMVKTLISYIMSRDTLKDNNSNTNIELHLYQEVGITILLVIVTFGIYLIFWYYRLAKALILLTKSKKDPSLEFVLILFVPFYNLIWLYQFSKSLSSQYKEKVQDQSTLYLILGIFGFNIISLALLQNDINVIVLNNKLILDSEENINNENDIKSKKDQLKSELEDLKSMLEEDILTQEEYELKRKQIIEKY